MPSTTLKRRWTEDGMRGRTPKKSKKIKRQLEYHSSSSDNEDANSDDEVAKPSEVSDVNAIPQSTTRKPKPILKATDAPPVPIQPEEEVSEEDLEGSIPSSAEEADLDDLVLDDSFDEAQDSEDGSEEEGEDDAGAARPIKQKSKRNDPTAFANSMSHILSSKLSIAKRQDPLLSRSAAAAETSRSLNESRLEAKARSKIRDEKRLAKEKGRVKDVLGVSAVEVDTGKVLEEEKRLRKTAQRGVIRMFNAVRAAQVKGEEAAKSAKQEGILGLGKREERVAEMSKQGFLDMIAGGGKKEGSVEV
jgi:fusion and transport protein UGO1